jgi:hypothetical protein
MRVRAEDRNGARESQGSWACLAVPNCSSSRQMSEFCSNGLSNAEQIEMQSKVGRVIMNVTSLLSATAAGIVALLALSVCL